MGKLYMFLDPATMNVWLEDRDANLEMSRKTWPEFSSAQFSCNPIPMITSC